ncbi:BirA family biotin operon repressor/biotin-[acetyl-CoA-carboxylase] ligase [Symbiobacterium terraclitae]|uniref:Bifunctional ligase/repressor BirA n=1 Tax=Symbiobacterium terraclitae TaxID=557451 RepID=A0ABS4JW22_9FIRM|nr:biotin--[acetyl-CoA-carboxylase] ligase [Symbiobacterium terraclitae]MBP2019747.1 BirA family biotin operon repressor/biotin-[acetyl-CoA-carboxylase] ligase [Symbiobacterium terraclitae]
MTTRATSDLLTLFAAAEGGWVSGEAISRSLGVSRTAVWKQVEALRTLGYLVEAAPRKGYRLIARPDLITPEEVRTGLATRRLGQVIEYRPAVGSTNDLAKELARQGAPEGLLVLADQQTAGKGRMGRSWATPPGAAIAMSVVLRPDLPPYLAPRITLAAAVAVAEAVRDATGLAAGIKWPNDVQIGGRKLCGILTEMEAEMDRVAFVVVGIGVNVGLRREQMDPAFRDSATSLALEGASGTRRAALVQAILLRLEQAYDDLLAGRFPHVLDRWRALSVTLGRPVRVLGVDGQVVVEGVAEQVDEEGALLVRDDGGRVHRVFSGEVSLRPA